VATAGYITLVGAAAVGLLLAIGISSPPALRLFRRTLLRRTGSAALTTAELCRQWQDSYRALQAATTDAARLRIVEIRQHCLDELELRDPDGLNAWLESTSSPAGDPSRFLSTNIEDIPPIDG
jgi:hypothetical protein